MGFNRALEMRQYGGETVALRDHLSNNLYPPVPQAYDAAVQALANVREGKPEEPVLTASGKMIPSSSVIMQLHLDAFLVDLEEAYNESNEEN